MRSETRVRSVEGNGYRKYEVDANRFQLQLGDRVHPETVVGLHHLTGEPVTAGLSGRVATIYFNPKHGSMLIMAISTRLNQGG